MENMAISTQSSSAGMPILTSGEASWGVSFITFSDVRILMTICPMNKYKTQEIENSLFARMIGKSPA